MDFQIGIEQAIDQKIGAEMNAIAAIELEQDRGGTGSDEDTGVEPRMGADVDEDVGPISAALRMKRPSSSSDQRAQV